MKCYIIAFGYESFVLVLIEICKSDVKFFVFLKSNLSRSLGLGLAPGIVDVAEVALMIVGLAPPLIGGSICVCSVLFAFVCYCYSVVWTNLHLCCTIVTQIVFKNTESIVAYFKKNKNHWAFTQR